MGFILEMILERVGKMKPTINMVSRELSELLFDIHFNIREYLFGASMYVTAEVSLYPLQEEFLPSIFAFVSSIQNSPGLEVTVNQMSTQFSGELQNVMRAFERALEMSFKTQKPTVLVAKFLNSELPLNELPVITA